MNDKSVKTDPQPDDPSSEMQRFNEAMEVMTLNAKNFYSDLEKNINSSHGIYLMIAGAVMILIALGLRISVIAFTGLEFITLLLIGLFLMILGSYYLDKNGKNLQGAAQMAQVETKKNFSLAAETRSLNYGKKSD